MVVEWQTWQFTGTCLLGVLLLILISRRRGGRRLAPGPTPWPVLGNLPQLGTLPHQTFMKLAKQYGPVMSLKLGSSDAVVASSPQAVAEFLKNQDVCWAARRPTAQGKIMNYGAKSMLFTDYGPPLRSDRKFYTSELFTSHRLQTFQNSRQQEILRGLRNVINECCNGSKAASVDSMIRRIGVNVMLRMLLIDDFRIMNEEAKDMKDGAFPDTIKEAFKMFGVVYIPDYVPWLEGIVQRKFRQRMDEAAKEMDDFFQSIVDDHRLKLHQGMKDGKPQDLVDILLTSRAEDDGKVRSDIRIKSIIQEIIIAGSDTTATTVEWGMSELLKNRTILEKTQREIDQVLGRDRLVQESDLVNLPYLHAVVKETFRLHPPGPLLVPHASSEASEVWGYKFPARTTLFVNAYAIQRDPEVWESPLEFKPERFLNSSKDVQGLDFDILPFGTGRRICPGKSLGYLQTSYAMAVMLQTCEWKLGDGLKPEDLDMDECMGLTVSRLNPLHAVVTPRVALNIMGCT